MLPPTTAPPTTPGTAGCTATYQLAGTWTGGFQGGVTVTNSGSSTVDNWTVRLTLPGGDGRRDHRARLCGEAPTCARIGT